MLQQAPGFYVRRVVVDENAASTEPVMSRQADVKLELTPPLVSL